MDADVSRARLLTASETAWLAAVPTALVTALAILVLGPPIGGALFEVAPVSHFSRWTFLMQPEPVEHGRYLLALAGPLVLAAATVVSARGQLWLPAGAIRGSVTAAQVVLLAFVVVCLMAQWEIGFGRLDPPTVPHELHRDYFSAATLVVAALGSCLVLIATRSTTIRSRFDSWTRDTRTRRVGAGLVAATAIVVWLLHAYNTEGTLAGSYEEVDFHAVFTLDETFAVLEGRTPLVDFSTQYAALWPYLLAGAMSLLGDTVGVWVGVALTVTGLSMLAAFALLKRVARSAIAGALLFLPVLATSFFPITEAGVSRYTYANYYGAFPLRYAAPLVLAWLLGRHLDAARPRAAWPLFLVCGLIVLNGPEIGIPAVGATVGALIWAGGRPTPRAFGQLALHAGIGLLSAVAMVSVLTLVRAGSLPDVDMLLGYTRVFAEAGFGMEPMPTLGLHTVIYLTFVAAIAVATARACSMSEDRVLTGLLAWSGIFGLGAGAYYVGRSVPGFLTATFSWWSLALALLLVAALRSLGPARRPGSALPIGQAACVFAFCVAACSLAQTPTPWGQIDRLEQSVATSGVPNGQTLVARHARKGEPVAILTQFGHRIAYNLGVDNVAPYTGTLSMPLREQLARTIAALRQAGGDKVIFTPEHASPDFQLMLGAAGFRQVDTDARTAMDLWVDERRRPQRP